MIKGNYLITLFNLILLLFTIATFAHNDGGQSHENISSSQGDIDWDERATQCTVAEWKEDEILDVNPYMICYKKSQQGRLYHVPMNETIDDKYPKDQIPNNGPHRYMWGVYGEYKYLPPGYFVHNLEHGAVAFLYHPCTPSSMVDALRILAEGCTWKHVMSAYPKILNETFPMAIVTFGCEYRMAQVNLSSIQAWLRTIGNSPEARVFGQGTYNRSLIRKSVLPENLEDTAIPFCSNVVLPEPKEPTQAPLKPTTSTTTTSTTAPAKSPSLDSNITSNKTPRTTEAYWAVGSLAFLLAGLVAAVCYTQLWRKGNQGESFEKSRVWNDESTPGSVSVAAIVRKFPHMIKDKMKKANILKSSKTNHYHRVMVDNDTCSEDEL